MFMFDVRRRGADPDPAAPGRPRPPASAPAPDSPPRLIGLDGTVIHCCGRTGRAAVRGDVWQIRYPAGRLHAGQQVRVVGQWGDVLLVIPAPATRSPATREEYRRRPAGRALPPTTTAGHTR